MKKTYIGITIGPIARVQSYAKKTRGIWASSYLFSYIAKNIIKNLKDHVFIKPTINNEMFELNDGIGRFPDQYVFEKKKGDSILQIRKICDNVLDSIATDMLKILGSEECKTQDEISKYIKRNIRIILFEREFEVIDESLYDDLHKLEEGIIRQNAFVIEEMQHSMNIMECRDSFNAEETRNYLADYIESRKDSLLIKEVLKDKQSNLFDTVIECTTCGEFIRRDDNGYKNKNDREELIEGKKDHLLKPYQKYIALVCGDGDNFGKTLAKYGNKVSGIFSTINDRIKEKVGGFGGQVIYQGGDDLFFFAPVYNPSLKKDVFGLIKDINNEIQELIDNDENINKITDKGLRPSLSFGVSISYHKFPIAESRHKAEELLENIKNVEKGQPKNKIRWCVHKHSGQTFGGIIDKNNLGELEKFIDFVGNITINKEDKSIFLHSVTYWLVSDAEMLKYILKKDDRETLLKNYRKANFNEDEHEEYNDFLDKVVDFLLNYEEDEGLEKLASILRYITLLLKDKE